MKLSYVLYYERMTYYTPIKKAQHQSASCLEENLRDDSGSILLSAPT